MVNLRVGFYQCITNECYSTWFSFLRYLKSNPKFKFAFGGEGVSLSKHYVKKKRTTKKYKVEKKLVQLSWKGDSYDHKRRERVRSFSFSKDQNNRNCVICYCASMQKKVNHYALMCVGVSSCEVYKA